MFSSSEDTPTLADLVKHYGTARLSLSEEEVVQCARLTEFLKAVMWTCSEKLSVRNSQAPACRARQGDATPSLMRWRRHFKVGFTDHVREGHRSCNWYSTRIFTMVSDASDMYRAAPFIVEPVNLPTKDNIKSNNIK